jgi:hypothetical protein
MRYMGTGTQFARVFFAPGPNVSTRSKCIREWLPGYCGRARRRETRLPILLLAGRLAWSCHRCGLILVRVE